MDRLNYSHLYYFYVIALEGSIKGACQRLHLSQPTLSDQLKSLEEFFGCRLFDRKNRQLILNKNGEIALEHAREIFSCGQDLVSILRGQVQGPKKFYDIGITNFMSQYFIYDWFRPFINRSQGALRIKENERHYLLADLEMGEVDMVISDSKMGIGAKISAHRLGTSKVYVVAHKKFSHLKRDLPQSLNQIPYISYTKKSSLHFEIGLFFRSHGLAPTVIGEADDVDLMQVVVESGRGFCIVPDVAAERLCQAPDVIKLGAVEDLETSVWALVQQHHQDLVQLFFPRLHQGN